MSYHTSDGHRRSARHATNPPPDPDDLSTSTDDGTTILYHEDDDVTTIQPTLTPPILHNPINTTTHRDNTDTATMDVPSVRSSDVSVGLSKDPPSNHGDPPHSQQRRQNVQNQHFSHSRACAYSSHPSRSGTDSIPESITTHGGLHPDTTRVHQQAQLDDLAYRVLQLDTRINHQNELVQSSLQQIMQALNLPPTVLLATPIQPQLQSQLPIPVLQTHHQDHLPIFHLSLGLLQHRYLQYHQEQSKFLHHCNSTLKQHIKHRLLLQYVIHCRMLLLKQHFRSSILLKHHQHKLHNSTHMLLLRHRQINFTPTPILYQSTFHQYNYRLINNQHHSILYLQHHRPIQCNTSILCHQYNQQ